MVKNKLEVLMHLAYVKNGLCGENPSFLVGFIWNEYNISYSWWQVFPRWLGIIEFSMLEKIMSIAKVVFMKELNSTFQ